MKPSRAPSRRRIDPGEGESHETIEARRLRGLSVAVGTACDRWLESRGLKSDWRIQQERRFASQDAQGRVATPGGES